jgi:phosphatidylglycerophosphatase A
MPSQSLLKTQEEAGLKSQDKDESHSPLEDMLNLLKLKRRFKSFAQWVTSDSDSLVIREIAGTISCMAVIAWVSGYTFGTWFHNTKKQLINKINDKINRTL